MGRVFPKKKPVIVRNVFTPPLDYQTFVWATNQGSARPRVVYKILTSMTGRLTPSSHAAVSVVICVGCQGGSKVINSNLDPTVIHDITGSPQGAASSGPLFASINCSPTTSGGTITGGAAEVYAVSNQTTSGGVEAHSAATASIIYNVVCTISTTISGLSSTYTSFTPSISGVVQGQGYGTHLGNYSVLPFGGSYAASAATYNMIANVVSASGLSLGTSGNYYRICYHIGSGGTSSSGNANCYRVYTRTPTGGVTLGSAPTGFRATILVIVFGVVVLTVQLL